MNYDEIGVKCGSRGKGKNLTKHSTAKIVWLECIWPEDEGQKVKGWKDKIVLASNERVDCISLINDVNPQNIAIAIVIIVIVKTDDGDIYQVILSAFWW